jgi:hypothetical protein
VVESVVVGWEVRISVFVLFVDDRGSIGGDV